MPTRLGTNAIVLADPNTALPDRWGEARVVHTPLDLILALDGPVDIVVLAGGFVHEAAICGFLREQYPKLDIVANVACAHVSRPRAFPRGSMCAIEIDQSGDAAGGEHTDSVEPRYS